MISLAKLFLRLRPFGQRQWFGPRPGRTGRPFLLLWKTQFHYSVRPSAAQLDQESTTLGLGQANRGPSIQLLSPACQTSTNLALEATSFCGGLAICKGIELGQRVRSTQWIWLDQEQCDMEVQSVVSPFLCYFQAFEPKCPDQDRNVTSLPQLPSYRFAEKKCPLVRESNDAMTMVLAGTVEYLFVIQEARRQIGILFPNGIVPKDLVTVHI